MHPQPSPTKCTKCGATAPVLAVPKAGWLCGDCYKVHYNIPGTLPKPTTLKVAV